MTTMTLNTKLNGIELRFDEKPTEAIRTALKGLGFRWSPKQSMWRAKQNEDRLALAQSLIAEKPKAKKGSKAKKAETVAEPVKAESKAKAEKPKTIKLSDLSEKVTYAMATADGFVNRKGYKFTATVGRRKLELGVHKEKDNTWTVVEATTGKVLTADSEKRYLALATVTVDLFESVYAELKKTKKASK